MGLAPDDNVSVCGWHDAPAQRYVATHRVLQFPERESSGDVCELLPLVPELARTARSLLDALHYIGPFELEFVRDARTGRYCPIESNPRFWIQRLLAGGNWGPGLGVPLCRLGRRRAQHGAGAPLVGERRRCYKPTVAG